MSDMSLQKNRPLCLALAGGNALGAFHAGALSALSRVGLAVETIGGVSIGAINTVLFAAPRNGDPEATLRLFWKEVAQEVFGATRGQTQYTAALSALMFGRPTMTSGTVATLPTLMFGRNALQDAAPLRATLERLVDFERLSTGSPRVLLGATALDPDEPRVFDSTQMRLGPEHVLASAALPVLFPPVTIDGRTFVDGGLTANLPVEAIGRTEGPTADCLALDLFSASGRPPDTLDAAIERLQNQVFGFQSDRVLANVPSMSRPLRVLYSAYRPIKRESAGKSLDFSRGSIERRWTAGEEAMTVLLEKLKQPAEAPSVERI